MRETVFVLSTVLLLFQAGRRGVSGQRNSYLDLWKNVFDELPENVVDEAVVNVESSILSSQSESDGPSSSSSVTSSVDNAGRVIHAPPTMDQLHGQGGSRLMQYLEKRRERREQLYAAKHGVLPGLLRDGDAHDRLSSGSKESDSSSLLRQLIRQGDSSSPESGMKKAHHTAPKRMKFRQLGIPVPDKTQFDKVLCFRIQNFGNKDGYYGASSSGEDGSCSTEHASQRAFMSWKGESFFTIDCGPSSVYRDTDDGEGLSQNASFLMMNNDASSGVAHMRAVSQRMKPGLSCTMAVVSGSTSSHGSGAIIRATGHKDTLMPLDAIGLKLCNVKSETRNPAGESLKITLDSLKLNGKSLTGEHLSQPQKHATEGGCQEHVLRVPTVSLADTFVLTGILTYNHTNEISAFDPGKSSSVDLSIGHAHLV